MHTGPAARTLRALAGAALVVAALSAACSTPEPAASAAPTGDLVFGAPSAGVPAAQAPRPPVAPPPPLDIALRQAVVALAGSWVEGLAPTAGTARRALVALPFIDVATGTSHALTSQVETSVLTELRGIGAARLDIQPLTPATLKNTPLLLTGTLARPPAGGAAGALSLCLVMIDTRAGLVVAQASVRARAGGVAIPPAIVRDAPVWMLDAAANTHLRACSDAKVGNKADAAFLAALPVAALMATANEHCGAGRMDAARTALLSARAHPAGKRADVLSGLYLTEWRLKRAKAAEQAYGELMAHGFATRRVGLVLPFKPGSAELPAGKLLAQPLPMWWKQIAQHVPRKNGSCLHIDGHAGRGVADDAAASLSFRRAFVVRTQLVERVPRLGAATVVDGLGSGRMLVGSGANDASDALDRRVELSVEDC